MSDAFRYGGVAKQTGQCTVCPKPIKSGDTFYWNNMQGKGARACESCAIKGGGKENTAHQESTPTTITSAQFGELMTLLSHMQQQLNRIEAGQYPKQMQHNRPNLTGTIALAEKPTKMPDLDEIFASEDEIPF